MKIIQSVYQEKMKIEAFIDQTYEFKNIILYKQLNIKKNCLT